MKTGEMTEAVAELSEEVNQAAVAQAMQELEAQFEGHLRAAGTCINVALGTVSGHPRVNRKVLTEAATLFTAGFKRITDVFASEIQVVTPADTIAAKARGHLKLAT